MWTSWQALVVINSTFTCSLLHLTTKLVILHASSWGKNQHWTESAEVVEFAHLQISAKLHNFIFIDVWSQTWMKSAQYTQICTITFWAPVTKHLFRTRRLKTVYFTNRTWASGANERSDWKEFDHLRKCGWNWTLLLKRIDHHEKKQTKQRHVETPCMNGWCTSDSVSGHSLWYLTVFLWTRVT